MEGADAVTTPVLQFDDVHLQRGARQVLRGASFDVGQGELVAVMGPSGSGKTTILRAIAGLEVFQDGRVTVDGVSLTAGDHDNATLRALRRQIGLVFQFHCLFEHVSALENVWLAPVHAHGVRRDEAERQAQELLKAFGVDHRVSALPRELSGGEAQRVAIARALAVNPRVLLLDEPTAALDQERRAELGALLRNLVGEGRTLLVVTHDEEIARAYATRTLRLSEGRVS
jgi:ABC-type polar amino acid transport system ATPase subunit